MKGYSKKSERRRGFIYFRYIFPILASLIMIGLLFVPAYRFITAETGINDPISIGELMGNSWGAVREYLFGESTDETLHEVATQYFAQYMLVIIIVSVLLFAVGLLSQIWAAVNGFAYFKNGCADSKRRALFITLAPNRTVLCIYHALTLPIFLFGICMPLIYRELLNTQVEISYAVFDMLWAALAVFAAEVAVIAVSASFEKAEGMDIFARYKPFTDSAGYADNEEPERATDTYTELELRAKREQAERIRRLLEKQNDITQDITKEDEE